MRRKKDVVSSGYLMQTMQSWGDSKCGVPFRHRGESTLLGDRTGCCLSLRAWSARNLPSSRLRTFSSSPVNPANHKHATGTRDNKHGRMTGSAFFVSPTPAEAKPLGQGVKMCVNQSVNPFMSCLCFFFVHHRRSWCPTEKRTRDSRSHLTPNKTQKKTRSAHYHKVNPAVFPPWSLNDVQTWADEDVTWKHLPCDASILWFPHPPRLLLLSLFSAMRITSHVLRLLLFRMQPWTSFARFCLVNIRTYTGRILCGVSVYE